MTAVLNTTAIEIADTSEAFKQRRWALEFVSPYAGRFCFARLIMLARLSGAGSGILAKSVARNEINKLLKQGASTYG